MATTFTITGEQISSIHNAMCSLYRIEDFVSGNFNESSDISRSVKEVFNYLKPVRDELMKAKDMQDDKIYKQAVEYARQNNFKHTVWSIYNINSLFDDSNVPVGARLTTFYSKESVVVGGTEVGKPAPWIELWKAVEELANKSEFVKGHPGFGDHRFIEKFNPVKDQENTFEVWLGS